MISSKKRQFLHQLAGLIFFPFVSFAEAGITPPQSLGPFYPSRLPLDSDSDLTFVEGEKDSAACLLYTSPSPRDVEESRMPSSA